MFKNKNLLVLSHTYNSFIKDPVETLAKDFNKVYVLVRYQPIAELGNFIPLGIFQSRKKYSKRYSIDLRNKPDNVEVIPVPLWYLPFSFFYKFVGKQHANKVLKILKKQQIEFDLIHAHFAWSAGYAGMKVKEKYGKPLVVTGHGYDIYDMPFRNKDWHMKIKKVLENSDSLLTVSENNRDLIAKMGVEKDVTVLSNGFSSDLFFYMAKSEAKEKLGFDEKHKVILSIGNLEKVKGYDILIKALNIVSKKRKDFIFIHIGEGVEEKNIRSLISEFELEDNVKLLGRRPHSELVYYYGLCDFFVSSSRLEGNPTVMFESLGCGKPFIGTKVGGVVDIINSEDYGKLVDSEDVEALAESILWALEKKWDNEKIAEYGKQYSWENINKKVLKIYKEIL